MPAPDLAAPGGGGIAPGGMGGRVALPMGCWGMAPAVGVPGGMGGRAAVAAPCGGIGAVMPAALGTGLLVAVCACEKEANKAVEAAKAITNFIKPPK